MGEVIRRNASADDIFADVARSLERARARGAPYQEPAERHLAGIVQLKGSIDQRLGEARAAAEPFLARLEAANDHADRLLGRIADAIWNDVGRPGNDPALALLFPGGIAYYADGDVSEQPDRMLLLVELLRSGIHPKLDPAKAEGYAREVEAEAAALRDASEGARQPRARLALLERVRFAVARTAQAELTALKRDYKAAHLGEAQIHEVIPDHPTAPRTKNEPPKSPT